VEKILNGQHCARKALHLEKEFASRTLRNLPMLAFTEALPQVI
jgi:hypothetical protein